MNKRTKRAQRARRPYPGGDLGLMLSDLLRRLRPPEKTRRHFEAARVEFLKGIRSLLDARIERISRAGAKGQKISVE